MIRKNRLKTEAEHKPPAFFTKYPNSSQRRDQRIDHVLQKIMIATDGKSPSYRAARQGVEIACLYGGQIVAVYAVDMPRLAQLPGYAGISGTKDKLLELMIRQGQEATQEVEQMAAEAAVPSSKVILKGHPSDELLMYSREAEADLLVMGTIGKSGLNRFLFGQRGAKSGSACQSPGDANAGKLGTAL